MYRHILALIDCTDDARTEAIQIARQFASEPTTRITIAANVTPTDDPALRRKKQEHARGALHAIGDLLTGEGMYARKRVLEAEDAVDAVLAEASRPQECYDLIVLGAHQARPEMDEMPCRGSLADRLALRASVPVMVLPSRPR